MDKPPEPTPLKPSRARLTAGSKWMLPKLPVLIGVAGLGAVVTTGTWFKRQLDIQQRAEVHGIQAEVAGLKSQANQYQERLGNLRWNAARVRSAAKAEAAEPLKTWLRERADTFEKLVAAIDQTIGEAAFVRATNEIDELCRRGDVVAAREKTMQLRPPVFPSPREFGELEAKIYAKPLAVYSRQNPEYYRALKTYETDIANKDIAALRQELAASDMEVITPQSLVMFELLSAVAPPQDPIVADWSAAASAADYFEDADATTLKRWREAQKAIRLEDWPTAFARMQSIALSTVRTRQPFRAAYGRAILMNRPGQTAEAYPFMQEAATAGDAQARSWIAQAELARGRFCEALPWLEASVAGGDATSVAPLLNIYAMDRTAVPRDLGRELGLLQKITVAPDALPLAWLLLGRLYEDGSGTIPSNEKAFACYHEAAQSLVAGLIQAARCHLRGIGTPRNLDAARELAVRAFATGEREAAVPLLLELMQESPDRTAAAVQELLAHEQIASPSGFDGSRINGPGVAKLRMQVARFLDRKGNFAAAAGLYAESGDGDSSSAHRHAELTTVNSCEACRGAGKVQNATVCPTCMGKGTVTCGFCDGRGFSFTAGSPPCTTCGGSGGMVQEGRRVGCSACGSTGKGKGSVIKQTCVQCAHGRAACRECVGGWIKRMKDCGECRGAGARALADP